MGSELFRKSALDRLSAPEQLNEPMRLTSPRAWIALSGIGLLLACALAWGFLGSLPASVSGAGILIRPQGTFSVVSDGTGVITFLRDLGPGSRVAKGEIIASISRPLLTEQVGAARRELERAEELQSATQRNIVKEEAARQQARDSHIRLQQDTITALDSRIRSLENVQQNQQDLLKDGLITARQLEETTQRILAARNEITAARKALNDAEVQRSDYLSQQQMRLSDTSARVAQARARLDQLNSEYRTSAFVTSEHEGAVIEVSVASGASVQIGQPVLRIEGVSDALQAVLYLPAGGDARRIGVGSQVRLSPAGYRTTRYGHLRGSVTQLSPYPTTERGMLALVQNEDLVRSLANRGPVVTVQVELIPDTKTTSGYAWSSEAGSLIKLESGTLVSGSVVFERTRPITLLIPILREFTGL